LNAAAAAVVVENDGCLHWLERDGNKKGKVMTFFVYFF
jgi:hypothetical protein